MVERYTHRRRDTQISHFAASSNSNHSSFSSSLLDAIYRSIDEGDEEMVIGTRKKSYDDGVLFKSDENLQRACMIEKWMEKKASEKAVGRRKSAADLPAKKHRESSAEFFSPVKPIRTGLEKEKPKIEGGFSKTKLRALKIYGDLKKVKQPISPGGKLAGFLNSLFAGGNPKKNKIIDDSPSLKSSTCSSASSFSRSCLSKTPSSTGKHAAGAKRSVKFSPVSVIFDEDLQPRGHKYQHSDVIKQKPTSGAQNYSSIRDVINQELMAHVREKNRRVEEVARDLLRNYQRGYENQLPFHHLRNTMNENYFDEEEEDDAASCASSDLFELDNLSAIGMDNRYSEELPVYETTTLDSMGKGLIF